MSRGKGFGTWGIVRQPIPKTKTVCDNQDMEPNNTSPQKTKQEPQKVISLISNLQASRVFFANASRDKSMSPDLLESAKKEVLKNFATHAALVHKELMKKRRLKISNVPIINYKSELPETECFLSKSELEEKLSLYDIRPSDFALYLATKEILKTLFERKMFVRAMVEHCNSVKRSQVIDIVNDALEDTFEMEEEK